MKNMILEYLQNTKVRITLRQLRHENTSCKIEIFKGARRHTHN